MTTIMSTLNELTQADPLASLVQKRTEIQVAIAELRQALCENEQNIMDEIISSVRLDMLRIDYAKLHRHIRR